MKINWTSKITWVNILSVVVSALALVADTYPDYAKVIVLVAGILTIVLRQLQGTTVKFGGKKIKL